MPVTATVDSLLDEYQRRYTERDVLFVRRFIGN